MHQPNIHNKETLVEEIRLNKTIYMRKYHIERKKMSPLYTHKNKDQITHNSITKKKKEKKEMAGKTASLHFHIKTPYYVAPYSPCQAPLPPV